VRNTTCAEARALADQALQQTTTADVVRIMQGFRGRLRKT
jgi:hypothetical protein